MRTGLGRFDRRLRAELHREFDVQPVDTPAPHRARYSRLARARPRPWQLGWSPRIPALRTVTLVTAIFAVGIMVGLVYGGRLVMTTGTGHRPVASGVPVGTALPRPDTAGAVTPSARPWSTARPPDQHGRAPASPAVTRPAFVDDFSADPVGTNPPGGWHADDGAWNGVVDDGGHVVRHGSDQPMGHMVTGSPQWSDYTVSAEVRTSILGLGYAGVAGRYRGPGDDYECTVGVGGSLQLWVVQGGVRSTLGESGIPLDLSGRHTVALEMRGSRLTCSLDGVPTLHATDTTFTAGRIALVASSGEAAEFGSVRVSG
jgi:hypothetical protein